MRIAVWCNIGGGFGIFPSSFHLTFALSKGIGENPGFKNQQNKIVPIKRTKMTAH